MFSSTTKVHQTPSCGYADSGAAQSVEKKKAVKDIAARVNAAKRAIDELKERIDAKAQERASRARPEDPEIVDEEEFALLRDMKEQKKVSCAVAVSVLMRMLRLYRCTATSLMLCVPPRVKWSTSTG